MPGTRPTDTVASILATPVATIRPTATLRDAATVLAENGVGLLVVVDARGVVGVLSERDLVGAIADEAELDVERVRERTSLDLVHVEHSASILEAARAMSAAEVRHLAVTDGPEVLGVVSMRDVLTVLHDALSADISAG